MADSILMYAITAGVFVGYGILLGLSRMQRMRATSPAIFSESGKKVKYTSDGKPLED